MRRAPAEVRKIEPDPVYKSLLVSQIINKVLWRGKKGAARRIVYGALEIVERRTSGDAIQVLQKAAEKAHRNLVKHSLLALVLAHKRLLIHLKLSKSPLKILKHDKKLFSSTVQLITTTN